MKPSLRVLVTLIVMAWATTLLATIPAYDSFVRADASTLGPDWTNVVGTLGIASNAAKTVTAVSNRAAAMYSADTFAADQWSEVKLTAVTSTNSFGTMVRASTVGGGQGYLLSATSINCVIYKLSGGTTLTSLADLSNSAVVGDTIKLEVVGTTLTAYKNGVFIGTTTNSDVTSGQPGIYTGANTATRLNDFRADNIGGGGGGGSATGGLLLRGVGAALWHRLWPFDRSFGHVQRGVVARTNISRQRVGVNYTQPDQQHDPAPADEHERQQRVRKDSTHLRSFQPERSDLSRASNIAQVARG